MRRFLTAIPILLCSTLMSFSAEVDEKEIPAGWDLSATLCFFRNLPLFSTDDFPETQGEVYYRHKDDASADGQSFTTTYQFFRETADGQYLSLSLVENHQLSTPGAEAANLAEAGSSHRVVDASHEVKVIPELPAGAEVRPLMSRVLAFVLDNRVALVESEAGELARTLNYSADGRVRSADYVQPRVCFVADKEGGVASIRVYGLATLINPEIAQQKQREISEDSVLVLSVDSAGKAVVEMPNIED